jgi:hypothetical protein
MARRYSDKIEFSNNRFGRVVLSDHIMHILTESFEPNDDLIINIKIVRNSKTTCVFDEDTDKQ